ncbi:MAG TPA: hypothetical protein VF982_02195 [Anaerolineales bacterium]
MGNSRLVTSNQQGIHPDLEKVVARHCAHPFQQPFKPVSLGLFEELAAVVRESGRPLVFDSGCGTGESTGELCKRHPGALVIGFDKSLSRIRKAEEMPAPAGNLVLLRADAIDLWRLAQKAGWKLQHHYLLYPNPWPKKQHLRRRWHGHPVFPDLIALGGILHLRSNWRIYLDEFAAAVQMAAGKQGCIRPLDGPGKLSAFEAKYSESSHSLFEFVVDLAGDDPIL